MNGILIVNKSKGYTSHDLVNKVKRISKEKVGHTGTLDPMATGVLPLLIGEATKLSKYLIEHDKEYEVKLQLGIKTDTADSEGKIIEQRDVEENTLQEDNIKNVLKSFLGKQIQTPPIYSAIKVKGKKLYEYARKGQEIEIPKREIEIFNISLKAINVEEKTIEFCVHCSKGTYIRSLCEDIAEKLQTVGYMKELKRNKVGQFLIQNSITVEELEKDEKLIENNIITMENFLNNKEEISLNDKQLELFFNGVKLKIDKVDDIYRIYNNEKFIGSGIVEESKLKRDIIL